MPQCGNCPNFGNIFRAKVVCLFCGLRRIATCPATRCLVICL
ncbi:hypothetical protein [Aquabacterium sp.]